MLLKTWSLLRPLGQLIRNALKLLPACWQKTFHPGATGAHGRQGLTGKHPLLQANLSHTFLSQAG